MACRLELVRERIHVGLVENRCTHPYSQRISHKFGFHAVGFLPLKHRFKSRESVALFAQVFGPAVEMRKGHPAVVPEAHWLAESALDRCGLKPDCIVDDTSRSYGYAGDYRIRELAASEYASVLRIERGRVNRREVLGPMRLQTGFFRMAAARPSYLVASSRHGPQIAAAIGFTHDEVEQSVRITELIVSDERSIRHLLAEFLNDFCAERDVVYVEVDVNAHSTRMQRTFLEMGFLPCAYVPAMAFTDVERVDALKMARLATPIPRSDQGDRGPSRR